MRTEKSAEIDKTAKCVNSAMGADSLVREYCVIHDSEIGRGCRIYERASIKKSKIGAGTDINAGTYIEFAEIESEVQIGPNCSIIGVFHQLSVNGAERKDSFEKITIGKNVFIGASCVILPGVEIGEGAVIGAGSIVTKNIPSFHICIGASPAQTIESLKEWLRLN